MHYCKEHKRSRHDFTEKLKIICEKDLMGKLVVYNLRG